MWWTWIELGWGPALEYPEQSELCFGQVVTDDFDCEQNKYALVEKDSIAAKAATIDELDRVESRHLWELNGR